MKFTFTDKKVNIPNRVHTYAEKKIGKLDRYFQTEPEASIVFSVEKGRNNLEVTIRSGATVIRVAESTSDMFVSIDAAVASIERQLRKNKSRLEKRLRKGAFDQPNDAFFVPDVDADEDAQLPAGAHQALLLPSHERGRGHPPDEPGGPHLLCLPQRG